MTTLVGRAIDSAVWQMSNDFVHLLNVVTFFRLQRGPRSRGAIPNEPSPSAIIFRGLAIHLLQRSGCVEKVQNGPDQCRVVGSIDQSRVWDSQFLVAHRARIIEDSNSLHLHKSAVGAVEGLVALVEMAK